MNTGLQNWIVLLTGKEEEFLMAFYAMNPTSKSTYQNFYKFNKKFCFSQNRDMHFLRPQAFFGFSVFKKNYGKLFFFSKQSAVQSN